MVPYLISLFGFIAALMLQLSLVSRTPLLSGTADVVLLYVIAVSLHQRSKNFWVLVFLFGFMVSFISVMPSFIAPLIYLAVFGAASLLRRRVWQTPLLAMFVITFLGTLFQQSLYLASLFLQNISFSFSTAFSDIILPSVLLNMLLAIPVHAIVQELMGNIYPAGADL
ncbi:MAG: hypothetical protein ACOYKD_00490 [Anaerolineaceae bacterium]|jgi:cell shape-determining protein MreD